MKKAFEVIPIEIESRRLDLNELLKLETGRVAKRFFQTYGFLWQLRLARWGFFLSQGKPHLQLLTGHFYFDEVFFGKESFEAATVTLGKTVPAAIRDVVLYHELREIFWMRADTVPRDEAHARAIQDEQNYVAIFLPESERWLHECFLRKMETEKRWLPKPAPARVKSIRDCVFI